MRGAEQNVTKSILVTGASTGFGQEIALHLAEQGFDVYATMDDLSGRADLEAAMSERHLSLRILQLDVTDRASIAAAVRTIIEEAGGIYGVVNNATMFLRGYFEDLLESEIRQVFETNLFGTMAVTQAVLPYMRAARRGKVVIISSVAGKIGAPSGSAYSSSRFAQEGFAESLAQEVEPLGIDVALIESGISKNESWTIDRAVAARARDPERPYHAAFHRSETYFERRLQRSPITARHVAEAVHRALTDRRPRHRYVVGRLPKLVIAARRYSPGEMFEKLYFGAVMRRLTARS